MRAALASIPRDLCILLDESHVRVVPADGRVLIGQAAAQLRDSGVSIGNFAKSLTRFESIIERLSQDDTESIGRMAHLLAVGGKVAAVAGGVGAATHAIDPILEPLKTRASQSWAQVRAAHRFRGSEEERLTVDDPLKMLTDALVADIAAGVRRRGCRFVLALDTYEQTGPVFDHFVIQYFLPSLDAAEVPFHVIVAGRQPPDHHSRDWLNRWNAEIAAVPIAEFSAGEIAEYLQFCCDGSPVPVAEIQERLGGLPLVLERWRIAGMPPLEGLSGTAESIFNRFTQWLQPADRSALLALAVPSWVDEDVALALVPGVPDAYDRLIGDETLFKRRSVGGSTMREPLRTSTLHILASRPTFMAQVGDRYAEHLIARLKRHVKDLEDGGVLNTQARRSATSAVFDLLRWHSEPASIRAEFTEVVLACAYLNTEDLDLVPADVRSDLSLVVQTARSCARGESAAAAEAVRKLAQSSNDNARYYALLLACTCFRRTGRLTRSDQVGRELIALRPSKYAYVEAGLTKMLLGRYQKAADHFDSALAIDFSFAPAWACKGELERQQGRWQDCAYSLEMAILSGNAPDYVYAERADALLNLGLVEEAYASAQHATTANPADYWNHAILATVLEAAGRADEAAERFGLASNLCTDDYSRACVAALRRDFAEALRLLAIALRDGVRSRDWAKHDPDWRDLAADPRFRELIAKR
ncbi:tetratricopeptide repeat protein [Actinoplanes sp. CA-131856]